jgi:hypothetical protein
MAPCEYDVLGGDLLAVADSLACSQAQVQQLAHELRELEALVPQGPPQQQQQQQQQQQPQQQASPGTGQDTVQQHDQADLAAGRSAVWRGVAIASRAPEAAYEGELPQLAGPPSRTQQQQQQQRPVLVNVAQRRAALLPFAGECSPALSKGSVRDSDQGEAGGGGSSARLTKQRRALLSSEAASASGAQALKRLFGGPAAGDEATAELQLPPQAGAHPAVRDDVPHMPRCSPPPSSLTAEACGPISTPAGQQHSLQQGGEAGGASGQRAATVSPVVLTGISRTMVYVRQPAGRQVSQQWVAGAANML